MSLEIILTVTEYSKESNTCTAKDSFGRIFNFDPFVGCAIHMSDEQHESGYGYSIVGNKYCVHAYSFRNSQLLPEEGGIALISQGEPK